MANPEFELGIDAALAGRISAKIEATVKLTRRYIWVMKLRYIWAIIRAKF